MSGLPVSLAFLSPPATWEQWLPVIVAAILGLAEIVVSLEQRTPFWLLRRTFSAPRRLLGEHRFLGSICRELAEAVGERGTVRAIKARAVVGTMFATPLIDQLQAVVEQRAQVAVLSEPGAGKTTVLQSLAWQLARRAYWRLRITLFLFFGLIVVLTIGHSVWWLSLLLTLGLMDYGARWRLPLLIRLPQCNPTGSQSEREKDFFRDCLALHPGGSGLYSGLNFYARRGRLVWLLDGIDELSADQHDAMLTTLRSCLDDGTYFQGNTLVVTSRHGDNPAVRLGLGQALLVWDLDDDGVKAILKEHGSDDVARDWESLEKQNLLGGRGVGRNPYWLSLMCECRTFSRNRGALTDAVARRRLQQAAVDGRNRMLSPDDGVEILGHLAVAMSDTNQVGSSLEFARQAIAPWLEQAKRTYTADQALDEAENAGLLAVTRRLDRVEFSHELLQEFFTAAALRRNVAMAKKRVDDVSWWGVYSLLGGLVGNLTPFVQHVLSGGHDGWRPFLAVAMLQNVDKRDEQLTKAVTAAFVESLRREVRPEQIHAADRLASIAPDILAALLGMQFHGPDLAVKRNVLKILDGIGGNYALAVLLVYRALVDLTIRDEATRLFVKIGEPAVGPLISAMWADQAMSHEIGEALERIGLPAVEPLLAAVNDPSKPLCLAAYEVLGWIGEKRAVDPLVKILTDNTSTDTIRAKAAESLERIGSAAVPALVGLLTHENETVRLQAIAALGGIRDPESVPPLLESLRDASDTVRVRATDALGRCGDERAVESLLYLLRNRAMKDHVRAKAAEALGWLRFEPVVKPLIEALEDKKESVRAATATALGRIQDARVVKPLLVPLLNPAEAERVRAQAGEAIDKHGKGAVMPLIASLRNADPHLRTRAAEVLGRVPDPRAVEPLIAALKAPEEQVQLEACTALGAIADERAKLPLLDILRTKERTPQVRARAARALGRFRAADVLQALIEALKDSDYQVRRGVVDGLGQIGDAQAVEPLLGALRDENPEVRWETTEALGRIGERRTAGPLLSCLQNKSELEKVRMGAGDAIGRTGETRAVEPLLKLLRDDVVEVRRGAILGLGRLGDARVVEPLIGALKDENYWVRSDAAEALARIGDRRAVEPLFESLRDENFWVRSETAESLGELRDLRALKPLFKALNDRKEQVRVKAAEALGKLGNSWSFKPLLSAMRDDNDDVRMQAALALGQIGETRAVGSLVAMLKFEIDQVRRAAAESLGRLGDPSILSALDAAATDTRHKSVAEAARAAAAAIRERHGIAPVAAAVPSSPPAPPESSDRAAAEAAEPALSTAE